MGRYSGFRWPTPDASGPGPWVEVDGALELGSRGIHACTVDALVDWIDDELWNVELDDVVASDAGVVLARLGRLIRRVERWNDETAQAFAFDCVLRAREAAVTALRRTGDAERARALASEVGLEALQSRAATAAWTARGGTVDSLVYVADAIELASGGRPERYGAAPSHRGPSPGAIAANLGFVVAHAIGHARADATADPSAYDEGVAAERARQRAWLVERLDLEPVTA